MSDDIEKLIQIGVWQDIIIHAYKEIGKLKGVDDEDS
jgi:hypothetical protein